MVDFKKHISGAARLAFEPGKFTLEVNYSALAKDLASDTDWRLTAAKIYETTSLRAAAAFRRHADKSAREFFDRAFQSHYDPPRLPPLPYLDSHQLCGVEWVLSRKRSYLAHAPGAGKTCSTITASLLAQGVGQCLFIVPPDLTRNWECEIGKFLELFERATKIEFDWLTVGVIGRSDCQDRVAWRSEILIVPDSMLTKEWVYSKLSALPKKLVAVDEASRFKEWNAERSLTFYGGQYKEDFYEGLFQDARHVVFLDGSPMPNRPMELWAPTYALHPEAIGCMSQHEFGMRYCGPKRNDRGNYEFKYSSNENELREKLREDFMHVVTEEELSHPERRRSLLFMNEDVRSIEHKTWERKHLSDVRLDALDDSASHYKPGSVMGQLATFRAELGTRKIDWVVDYVNERLKTKNESILLFAWHREVCEGLAAGLEKWKPGLVIGGVDENAREGYFKDFQLGARRLIVGNIAAMGRGHNLQKADRVIFAEYSWSDELNRQCEKRASRRGRDKNLPVRCEYVVAPGSMDEPVLQSLFTKQARVKKVIG